MKRIVSAMLIAVVVLSLLCTMASADYIYECLGVSLKVSDGDVAIPGYFENSYEGTSDIKDSYFQLYPLRLGKDIIFMVTIANTGTLNQYERLTLYSRWTLRNGNTNKVAAPCKVSFDALTEESIWEIDKTAQTSEKTVLYFLAPVLAGSGHELCVTARMPDSAMLSWAASQTNWVRNTDGTWSTCLDMWVYFDLQIDAVQDHNVADTAWSAWGVRISVDENGHLHLVYDE